MLRLAIGTLVNAYLVRGATPAGTAIERCEQLPRVGPRRPRARGDRQAPARPVLRDGVAAGRGERRDGRSGSGLRRAEFANVRRSIAGSVPTPASWRAISEGAERELKGMFEYFRDLRGGEIDTRASGASDLLAHLYCDQGRWDEAAEIFAYDPVARAVRARLAAHEGLPEALQLAEQAAASQRPARRTSRRGRGCNSCWPKSSWRPG